MSSIPRNDHENYHYFAVEITQRDFPGSGLAEARQASAQAAQDLAQDHGLEFVGRVGELDHFYLLASLKRIGGGLQKREAQDIHSMLSKRSDVVGFIEHQVPQKRLFKRIPPSSGALQGPTKNLILMDKREPQLYIYPPPPPPPPPVGAFGALGPPLSPLTNDFLTYRGSPEKVSQVMANLGIKDPGFPQQFHLFNTGQPGHDLNLTGVWEQGITGKNVTVTFLDDGVDHDHPDLKENFSLEASYDFNEHKKWPTPALSDDYHGTRCAGEVAALKNDVCGVGIAWHSKVSGVRILSGSLTISDESAAITYEYQKNDIYSCSWGPRDDGRTMEAPPRMAWEAFKKGIDSGRGGKGSIYVFAAGNGGGSGDNCNFDGYTNSIYTITVGAVERNNEHPSYSEICSANLVVTYSGPHGGDGIYTTDWLGHGCTNAHGGTSAAAPLASGVFALVLSIRPDLTWRDLQRLVVESAVPITLDDGDWKKVAKDRLFNHKFGYGLLDGWRIVENAKRHVLLKPQTSLRVPKQEVGDKAIPEGESGVSHSVMITKGDISKANISRLEHVTVALGIEHARRGDIWVYLHSPNGIVSELIAGRPHDMDADGFNDWTTMSVKHWDEDPVGNWTLQVVDKRENGLSGKFKSWSMILWGESGHPNATTPIDKPVTLPPAKPSPVVSAVPSISPNVSTPKIPVEASPALESGLPVKGSPYPGSAVNPLGVILGLVMLAVLGAGLFAVIILWRRVQQFKDLSTMDAAGGGFERVMEEGEADAELEEDLFAQEQQQQMVAARKSTETSRSKSPERRGNVLFETGPVESSDDENAF